jgi:hypothetical protein
MGDIPLEEGPKGPSRIECDATSELPMNRVPLSQGRGARGDRSRRIPAQAWLCAPACSTRIAVSIFSSPPLWAERVIAPSWPSKPIATRT